MLNSGESITEVEIKGGSAKATSVHSSSWNPEEAFKTTTKTGWHNKANPDQAAFPEMIWYEFPANAAFYPARISFRPGAAPDALGQGKIQERYKNGTMTIDQFTIMRTDQLSLSLVYRFNH